MRFRLNLLALLAVGLLAVPALAQAQDTSDKPADAPPAGDSEMKQKLLDNFDTNKDGTLDPSEARAIGRALRENFDLGPGPGGRGRGPEGRGPEGRRRWDGPPPGEGRGADERRGRGPDDGPPPGDRGPRASRGEGRGPGDRGPGGPDGPPRPPCPERLFNRFDENQDGSLSLEEFKALTQFVREHRPPGPPMTWRGGRGHGFDGPPRGDFERRGGEGRRRGDWREGPPGPPPGDGPPPRDEDPEDSI